MVATRLTRHPGLLAAALVAAGAMAAGTARADQAAEGSFDRTFKVTGPVQLDVQTGSGDIRVQPGAAGTVHVVGRIRGENSWFGSGDVADRIKAIEQTPPLEQQGNLIRAGRPDDRDLMRDISISYEITVPAECSVTARTGSGDQDIRDLKGPLVVHSGSGSINVGRIAGAVEATTGSGDIEIDEAASLRAHSGSGRIRAGRVAGAITADTGSGDVEVAQSSPGDVDLSSGSGDLTATGVRGGLRAHSSSGEIKVQGVPTGPWSVSASSGDITLELPPDAAFDLDARTSSGSIDSAHPVTMSGRIDRHALVGKARGGGPRVEVRSSSGSIELR